MNRKAEWDLPGGFSVVGVDRLLGDEVGRGFVNVTITKALFWEINTILNTRFLLEIYWIFIERAFWGLAVYILFLSGGKC